MAAPLIAALTSLQRGALPLLQRAVQTGLSAARIRSIFDQAGLGFRAPVLRDLISYYTDVQRLSGDLSLLPRHITPSLRVLAQAATRLRRSFSYQVLVEGVHTEALVNVSRFITVTSDEPLSIGAIQDIAAEIVEENAAEYSFEVTGARVVSGLRAGRAGTV